MALTLNFPGVDLDRDYVGLRCLDVGDGQVKDSTVFAWLLSKPPKADQWLAVAKQHTAVSESPDGVTVCPPHHGQALLTLRAWGHQNV